MISTCDPKTMTEMERRDEVATILTIGLNRCVKATQSPLFVADKNTDANERISLDLSSKMRLSVSQ